MLTLTHPPEVIASFALDSLLYGGLDRYTDNDIEILYPSGWTVLRPGINMAMDGSTHVIFRSPQNPSTFIRVSEQPTNFTLSAFTQHTMNNIVNNPDAKIMEHYENVTLSGLTADQIDGIMFQDGQTRIYVLDTWTINDNIAYRVTSHTDIYEVTLMGTK